MDNRLMANNLLNETGPLRVLINVLVGDQVTIGHFVTANNCSVGAGSQIGPFVELQSGVLIGENCHILSHASLCANVKIGDYTIVGQGVKFILDKYPPTVVTGGGVARDQLQPIKIGKKVALGSGAIIMSGVQIGDGAQVGAGAVVTKNVKANEVVYGVPARVVSKSSWEDL